MKERSHKFNIVYDSIHMKYPEQAHFCRQKRKLMTAYNRGMEWGLEIEWKGTMNANGYWISLRF